MKKIYKYPIGIKSVQTIEVPANALALHAGLDPIGTPCVWAAVHPGNKTESQIIYVIGTGDTVPERAQEHIGSFNEGSFMWHVFI